jgi:glutaminase
MPSTLADLDPIQLNTWINEARSLAGTGQVNQRIGRLAIADPHSFAIHIQAHGKTIFHQGDGNLRFTLMSTIKPFLLLYLLAQHGSNQVLQWVGTKPSDLPFNSLEQLRADSGFPRNPMINSGAITLAGHLPGSDAALACQQLGDWLNSMAGCQLVLDEAMLASVAEAGREPNLALLAELAKADRVTHPAFALATYEHICCLSATVEDLARLGNLLALDQPIAHRHRHRVNGLMLTCGLYEASADYALRVGLPMKSSISGALLAVVPGQGAIATYSPALDTASNPVVGLALLETLAQNQQLSMFA